MSDIVYICRRKDLLSLGFLVDNTITEQYCRDCWIVECPIFNLRQRIELLEQKEDEE